MATVLALLIVGGCDARLLPSGKEGGTPADSVRAFVLSGAFRMDESSAAALSARHPGVYYTINDSGNDPVLYAFDTTGVAQGRWVLRQTGSVDREALAVHECSLSGGEAGRSCVYISDAGDNRFERTTAMIYRVVEPGSLEANSVGEMFPDSLTVRYPDGPHDMESMVVSGDGSLLFFPKEPQRDPSGGTRPTLVYRVAPRTWQPGDTVVAELVDSIPIVPRFASRHLVTDAALDRSGRFLAVRTYDHVYIFAADSLTGRPVAGVEPALCDLKPLAEPQGEGVAFARVREATARLLLTTEGKETVSRLVDCPLPGS